MKKVDMSEQAILRRLKTVDQLREVCLSLMKAKKFQTKNLDRISKRIQNRASKKIKAITSLDHLNVWCAQFNFC
jgi:hypothetical protein